MGWIQSLYRTFENCKTLAGVPQNDGKTLLPICHLTQNAQLEVVLSEEGELISARTVDKTEAETIIPVTEDSGSRSSGIAPMPLCDKLIYVAGDYSLYAEKDSTAYFNAYINQLNQWVQSPYSNYMVESIYKYLSKATLIRDLLDKKLLSLNEAGILDKKVKNGASDQTAYFVRFRVVGSDNQAETAVWKSIPMYESFINYYTHRNVEKKLCYVTGEECICSEKHPAKIRNIGDKSKLISANDSSGFTYRGRFANSDEAYSISYDVSQKAHSALRWLLARQGTSIGNMSFVVWNVEDKDIPDVNKSTFDFYEEDEADEIINANSELDKKTADKLIDSIFGNKFDLQPADTVVYIAVEAATTGRLSISAYEELNGSEFLDNIKNWHKTCCWYKPFKNKDNTYKTLPNAPSLYDIVKAVKGYEMGKFIDTKSNIMAFELKRLLPCVIMGRSIPLDYVKGALIRASNREAYDNKYNYDIVLHVACSIIYKYLNSKGEEYTMALQEDRRDRSYLYGRLLAVARKIEEDVLRANKVERMTNAERYTNAFSKQPCKTWGRICNSVRIYMKSMRTGQRVYYDKILNSIYAQFKDGDFENNSRLDEAYILGYRCQLDEFYKKKSTNNADETEVNSYDEN